VLLNAPQFVEAARVLGEKLHKQCDGKRDPIVAQAFESLAGRMPDDKEREILARLYDEQRVWYAAHPDQAAAYLGIGETPRDAAIPAADLAAAATLVNALMNYDGCVMKR
jgi:hypothetical protein